MDCFGSITLSIVNEIVLHQDVVSSPVDETTYVSSEPVSPVEDISHYEGKKSSMVPEIICSEVNGNITDNAKIVSVDDEELTFSTPHGITTLGDTITQYTETKYGQMRDYLNVC